MRRVCLTIGVSRAEGLAPLRAAVTAAEEVGQWAKLSGFAEENDIRVLTDRKDAVTIELVAQALTELLPMGTQTDALLLHFAGHGLREDNTRTLWLPTDWRTTLRAIAVERLKNRLSDFGVGNVTIISDACKALANDKDTSDLTPDGVLGSGTTAGVRPIFDRYDAVHDVESAFMVPGRTPAESRCLFSGALMEALWGNKGAIDQHYPGMVTPGSLADYLTVRIGELCATYNLSCDPQNLPGRPDNHLIYFDESRIDAAAVPVLPAWPEPVTVPVAQGSGQAAPAGTDDAIDLDGVDLGTVNDLEFTPGTGVIGGFGPKVDIARDILGDTFGGSNPDISRFERRLQMPDVASLKLDKWVKTIARTPTKGPMAPSPSELDWIKAKARGEIEQAAVEEHKAERRKVTTDAFLLPEIRDPYIANLLFGGGAAVAVWSKGKVSRVDADQWLVDCPGPAVQLVVEYGDGVFLPVMVYRDLVTIAARDERGTNGWLLRSPYDDKDNWAAAVDVLGRMQSGDLPPSRVDEVAADLRESKHGNPVLGAICAYLYDYAGDVDSIRRMAYFYVSRGQPIPYDIALMGELDTGYGSFGHTADVPAIEARSADAGSNLPHFVTTATTASNGPVGGFCPWLRQGWDFVEAPTDRERALVQAVPDISKHLLPETFTSFGREGGEILVDHWGMERST